MFSKLVKYSKEFLWISEGLALIIATIYYFYNKKKIKGEMAVKEAFEKADVSKLNDEQLKEFNDMKNMML